MKTILVVIYLTSCGIFIKAPCRHAAIQAEFKTKQDCLEYAKALKVLEPANYYICSEVRTDLHV